MKILLEVVAVGRHLRIAISVELIVIELQYREYRSLWLVSLPLLLLPLVVVVVQQRWEVLVPE